MLWRERWQSSFRKFYISAASILNEANSINRNQTKYHKTIELHTHIQCFIILSTNCHIIIIIKQVVGFKADSSGDWNCVCVV